MHDYKGLVGSWDNILGLYHNMGDKHKEIVREGTEKERDCSVSRFNSYRIGVQSEKNYFQQELGIDINYASQKFLVEQINFHRRMTERLEQLYHKCWPQNSPGPGNKWWIWFKSTKLPLHWLHYIELWESQWTSGHFQNLKYWCCFVL